MWSSSDFNTENTENFIKTPIFLHHLKARLSDMRILGNCVFLEDTPQESLTIPKILLYTKSNYNNTGAPIIYLDYTDQNNTVSKIIIRFRLVEPMFFIKYYDYKDFKKIHLNSLTISYNDKKFTYTIPNNEIYEIIRNNYQYFAYVYRPDKYSDDLRIFDSDFIRRHSNMDLAIFISDNNKKIEFFNFCTELLNALQVNKDLNISCTLEPYTNLELLKEKVEVFERKIAVQKSRIRNRILRERFNKVSLLDKRIEKKAEEIAGCLERINKYKSEDIQKIIKSQNLKDYLIILKTAGKYSASTYTICSIGPSIDYDESYEHDVNDLSSYIFESSRYDSTLDQSMLLNVHNLFWNFPLDGQFQRRNSPVGFARFNASAEKWILEHKHVDLRKYLKYWELQKLEKSPRFKDDIDCVCIGKAISEYYNLPAFKNFLEDCNKLYRPYYTGLKEKFLEDEKNKKLFSMNKFFEKYVLYYKKAYWEQYPYETEGITPHNVYENLRNKIRLLEEEINKIKKVKKEIEKKFDEDIRKLL